MNWQEQVINTFIAELVNRVDAEKPRITHEDQGIGRYEYGGAIGFDTQIVSGVDFTEIDILFTGISQRLGMMICNDEDVVNYEDIVFCEDWDNDEEVRVSWKIESISCINNTITLTISYGE